MEEVGKIQNTRIVLVQGNITEENTDAIVNAANSSLLGGGGVDGAIHRAGGPSILEECQKIRNRQGSCVPGNAVITGGGKLQAKWVIHAVGPVWRGGQSNEPATLASAYRCSLYRALEVEAKSISFPSISTGAYGYPVEEAAIVAMKELKDFFQQNPNKIDELRFVLFDAKTYNAYKSAAGKVL